MIKKKQYKFRHPKKQICGNLNENRIYVLMNVVQVLLALWVGIGMHLVHPLFHKHCATRSDQTEVTEQNASSCCSCSHHDENSHSEVNTDSQTQTVVETISTWAWNDKMPMGPCSICSFLAQIGKWMYLVASPVTIKPPVEQKEKLLVCCPDAIHTLYLLTVQARDPPPYPLGL